MTEDDRPHFDYEAIFASLTEAERQYLLEAYGVPLDAMSMEPVYLQFLVTHRRIRQIEAAALAELGKPSESSDDG